MTSRPTLASRVRRTGAAAQVAGSQIALAVSNYVVLAVAARHLDPAGFAALSSYYLLINTVGRGMFAAVELEATRAVAEAEALGHDDTPAMRAVRRHTVALLGGSLILVVAAAPLLSHALGSIGAAIGLLGLGALSMAASYFLRGPLAGHRRYGLYAATFWIEAGVGLAAAATLVVTDVTAPSWWFALFALAPVVSAAALARPALRNPTAPTTVATTDGHSTVSRGPRGSVFWSAALLLAGQGVWNLAPVFVTSRLTDSPSVAAGFVTVAVILRAPVLLFPSVQAILLPQFTAMLSNGNADGVKRVMRRLGGALVVGGVVWVALALFVVPWLARLVFGTTVVPPPWILAVLAVSTMIGATAQIGQTQLVAARRPATVAVAWIMGLAVLVVVATLAAPPTGAATIAQLLAAIVVLVVLLVARRRSSATRPGVPS